jgi:hypothetical protein
MLFSITIQQHFTDNNPVISRKKNLSKKTCRKNTGKIEVNTHLKDEKTENQET